MNSSMDIAKYIVDYCTRCGKPITNLQLQKILYYVQLNFIRIFGSMAFPENIQAWQYGPVVPNVYERFSSYGPTRICNLYENIANIFSVEQEKLVNRVIDACTSITPWELVEKSHRPGGPWDRAYDGTKVDIPIEYIKEYARRD